MIESVFGKEKDLFFMQQALQEAQKAADSDEVPVGAVVVNAAGEVVSRAHNSVERDCTQRSHAESLAIEYAGKALGDWRLEGHWVYVTLEPCLMCIGLIKLSRLAGVVYGPPSPLFGFQLDKTHDLSVYQRDAFSIIEGVMSNESSDLLKSFFKKRGRLVSEKRDLNKIKEQLLHRKWELEEKLTALSKEQLSDGQVQDPGDQALASTMEALRVSLQGTEVDEYRRIVKALGKIDEGLYGKCVDCGNNIAEKRLQLFPDATRCLACQEAFEVKTGQDHDYTI